MAVAIVQVRARETRVLEEILAVFAAAFNNVDTYQKNRPKAAYLRRLLRSEHFICLAALYGGRVVGGVAAYELKKFEQVRSEIYIHDPAVDAAYRRKGIATAMIEKLKEIAGLRGAYLTFVQADTAPEDMPAIALYSKMGKTRGCSSVWHRGLTARDGPRKAPEKATNSLANIVNVC